MKSPALGGGRFRLAAIGLASAVYFCGLAPEAQADEGQWRPAQIGELDAAKLKEKGLQLPPEQLWRDQGDERSGGLMRAAVRFGGCSGAFVSSDGLIATNHHCAYGAVQAQSLTDTNLLDEGFVARDRAQEIDATGRTVRILRGLEDITAKVHAATAEQSDPAARGLALERVRKEIVAGCEAAHPDELCAIHEYFGGQSIELARYLELRDVRLVMVPPRGVGEFGGEIDNWMWPRHAGDFALIRAYVGPEGRPADPAPENRPYNPGTILPVSTDGVRPGDFVAVLGYPGHTDRYLPAVEVTRQRDQVLPMRVSLYEEWIEIFERHGRADPQVAIKVAALKKKLANGLKNARGKLEGLSKNAIVERRQAEDEAARKSTPGSGEMSSEELFQELESLSQTRGERAERDLLLSMLRRGPKKLAIALDLVRRAKERKKPDLERAPAFQDRGADRLWKNQESDLRDFDAGVDAALFASILRRASDLRGRAALRPLATIAASVDGQARPEESRGQAAAGAKDKKGSDAGADEMAKASAKASDPQDAWVKTAAALLERSRMHDRALVERLFHAAESDELQALGDPMIELAQELVPLLEASEAEEKARRGRLAVLGPQYVKLLRQSRPQPTYPDANSSLRFSYASVLGYTTWDGQVRTPQTTMGQALAKHTGEDPFILPDKVRAAAKTSASSRWADATVGDLSLCFLSNADTTGGNSGSPVIDGKGRLVGLNFDRVWENVAGDYGYDVDRSRNISADVRYLLWYLEEVVQARKLLEELGVGEPEAQPGPQAPQAQSETPIPKSSAGCACRTGPSRNGAWAWLGLLGLGLRARRRQRN